MQACLARDKLSQTSIAMCINLIQDNFEVLRQPDTAQRRLLRSLLFQLEDQCKSQFKTERGKLTGLIQRDPTLTEDDRE